MSDSEARIVCPNCGRKYKWSAQIAGKKVKCKCEAVIRVPAELTAPAAAPVKAAKPAPAKPAASSAPPLVMSAASDDYELDLPNDFKQPAKAAPAKPAAAAAKPAQAAPLAEAFNAAAITACPSCNNAVKAGAVICINCGFNLKEGTKLNTQTGGVVREVTGERTGNKKKQIYNGAVDGIFGRMSRSWEYSKLAYGILWDFKQLIVFPLLSMVASIIVLISFAIPTWALLGNSQNTTQGSGGGVPPIMYVLTFLFYFCSYFVIVFFNTALIACTMKVLNGEAPSIGYGLKMAMKRLPQIAAWALVSAVVGLLLKIIENVNEKIGWVISLILGSAWTVLTYFVVPVLAVEGIGPIKAVKQSFSVLRASWGEGVLGNFSLGYLTFLISLPLYLICAALVYLGVTGGNGVMIIAGVLLFLVVAIVMAAASSAADVIFKALLYNYATGRSLPAEVDESIFPAAFAPKTAN